MSVYCCSINHPEDEQHVLLLRMVLKLYRYRVVSLIILSIQFCPEHSSSGMQQKTWGIILHTSWYNKKSPLRSACTNIIISRNKRNRFLIQCSASKIFDANPLRRLSNSWKDSTSSTSPTRVPLQQNARCPCSLETFLPKLAYTKKGLFHQLVESTSTH